MGRCLQCSALQCSWHRCRKIQTSGAGGCKDFALHKKKWCSLSRHGIFRKTRPRRAYRSTVPPLPAVHCWCCRQQSVAQRRPSCLAGRCGKYLFARIIAREEEVVFSPVGESTETREARNFRLLANEGMDGTHPSTLRAEGEINLNHGSLMLATAASAVSTHGVQHG